MTTATVELSVSATSEELELLAAAARQRRVSVREFLRLQVMAAAKSVLKAHRQHPQSADSGLGHHTDGPNPGLLRPAFLP